MLDLVGLKGDPPPRSLSGTLNEEPDQGRLRISRSDGSRERRAYEPAKPTLPTALLTPGAIRNGPDGLPMIVNMRSGRRHPVPRHIIITGAMLQQGGMSDRQDMDEHRRVSKRLRGSNHTDNDIDCRGCPSHSCGRLVVGGGMTILMSHKGAQVRQGSVLMKE